MPAKSAAARAQFSPAPPLKNCLDEAAEVPGEQQLYGEAQVVFVYVILPMRVEIVVFGFLPAPLVLVMVVFPTFCRVVTLVPDLVVRMVVLPVATKITSFQFTKYHNRRPLAIFTSERRRLARR
ncbi:MAG: hypothetical protein ACLPSW_04940 [Roseiarcus sp.]